MSNNKDEDYRAWTQKKYANYIDNDENWQKKRIERMRIDDYTCQGCGSKGCTANPLQVHHLTYNNIYKEDVEKDLVTLCRSCHMTVHHMMNRITDVKNDRHGWKDTLTISTVVYDRNRQKIAEQYGGGQ